MTHWTETVDIDKLVTDVREFSELFPDVTYESPDGGCYYSPDESNVFGCVIGAGLAKQSFDLRSPLSRRSDGFDPNMAVQGSCKPTQLSNDQRLKWLARVQRGQDQGISWARSVTGADRMFPLP